MQRETARRRLWLAAKEFFLPFPGVKAMIAEVMAWTTIFGAVTAADVLPPSWGGKAVLVGLVLLFCGLGIAAAYRLRARIDALADEEAKQRAAERETATARHKAAVLAVHALKGEARLLRVKRQGAVGLSIPRDDMARVTAALEKYEAAAQALPTDQALRHMELITEARASLKSDPRQPQAAADSLARVADGGAALLLALEERTVPGGGGA